MPNPPRRVPVPAPNPHTYTAVPQTPVSPPRSSRAGSRSSRAASSARAPREYDAQYPSRGPSLVSRSQAVPPRPPRPHRDVTRSVTTGLIGNAFGPYSYETTSARDFGAYNQSTNQYPVAQHDLPPARPVPRREPTAPPPPAVNTSTVPAFMWDMKDPDLDDTLHNPDPIRDAALEHEWTLWSARGWENAVVLFAIVFGLLVLFAGYPIIHYASTHGADSFGAYRLGGVNATGQLPELPGLPRPLDPETPQSAYTRVGTDGVKYDLVFSDEFNTDGRSFYPGDDPYWEAVDLHYWPTGDVEWYDPSAVTTQDGKLVLTMSEVPNHELNFMSGMITSWNKLCFTTGYIEISVSMPGSPRAPGLWPAAWTMGNLGRAGYGATTEGLWPYSYDSCDLGTFPDQVDQSGNPAVVKSSGLSSMPGQRLSACTCPDSDHPGPSYSVGRSSPEIDVFETQIDVGRFQGQASQSAQFAPFNAGYELTSNKTPAVTIYNSTATVQNGYIGGPYQQAASALTYIDNANYNGSGYAPFGFEWWSNPSARDQGYITWFSQGQESWTLTAAAVGPDPVSQVSQRLISEEPHYVIMNLGMSPSFQEQDYKHMVFPARMYIDYVRIYQREGASPDALSCDPKSHPTADYINSHMNAYTNANLTRWKDANYTFPRNSLYNGCY